MRATLATAGSCPQGEPFTSFSVILPVYFVYILASVKRTLYIGVTNDLRRRVYEHKTGAIPGFTARYKVNRLVYFEPAEEAIAAIAREKQLKGWLRQRKLDLIEAANPEWEDLSDRAGLAQMVTRAG
jgi:putative endonuclease